MVDKAPGDRKLSVPNKTLTLKPRVETGTVKQSFSHGRTKQVVVEKRGKRRLGGDGPATEAPHAPEPIVDGDGGFAQADCPTGDTPVGGGYKINPADPTFPVSVTVDQPDTAGWSVQLTSTASDEGGAVTLTAYAVCAS